MSGAHDHGGPGCRELLDRLSDYLDGDLPAEVCAHVDAHLADCPPCRVFLESLRRTVRWIETSAPARMPEDLRREVLEAMSRLERGDRG